MFRKISQKVRKQDGFTLIELIVVVAILGILAAVLTPRVLNAIDNARANGAEAFGKELQLAMERYYLDKNGYPSIDEVEGTNSDTIEDADLVTLLTSYTSIDGAQFDTFTYTGYKTAGSTADADKETDEAKKPKYYKITLNLKDAGRTITVTPNSVSVSTN